MGARQTKGKDFYITIVIKQHVSTCMACCTVAKLLVLYSSAYCLISWSSTPLVLRQSSSGCSIWAPNAFPQSTELWESLPEEPIKLL